MGATSLLACSAGAGQLLPGWMTETRLVPATGSSRNEEDL